MMNPKRRDALVLFGILFWILFVLGGYYYYHKPITVEMIAAPALGVFDLFFALLFAGVAGGTGRRLLRDGNLSALELAVLQFALGSGIISLVWLAASLLGILRLYLGLPLLLLGTALLFRDVRAWFGEFRNLAGSWRKTPGLEKWMASIVVVFLLFQLMVALAPPVKWDALTYHLQLPRQYLAAGALIFIPENPYWGHPQLVEMLFTLAMSVHRPETAAVLNWTAGLLCMVGIFGFTTALLARLHPNKEPSGAGWAAVAAVAAGATFRYLLGWSYTEMFSILYGLAALVAFFQWLADRHRNWFLWACLFSGLAMGTKWTAGVLGAGIFLAVLFVTKRFGITFKDLLAKLWLPGGAVILLTVAPWLLKNVIATGNPIYPYFIDTIWFDSTRLALGNPPPETIDWWLHLLLPVSTTWTGIDSAPGFSTDLGPLLLLLAGVGFYVYRRTTHIQAIAIMLVPAALALGVGSLRYIFLMQTRLYYVFIPAAALAAGMGWAWLRRQVIVGVRLGRIFSAMILLVLILALWQDSQRLGATTPARVLQGTQTRQSYLENTLGFHILAMQKLTSLPSSSRILMLWEPRGFYAPLNAEADLWIIRWQADRREQGNARAILDHWRNQGYTHLLVYQQGVELIRPQPGRSPSEDWIVFQETLQRLPPPVSIGDIYYLYDLE